MVSGVAMPLALRVSMSLIQDAMSAGALVGSRPASLSTLLLTQTTLARWMLDGTE